MSRPELGTVVNAEDVLYPQALQILIDGLLTSGGFMSVGGDLTSWYAEKPAHEHVRRVSERVLIELLDRPTRLPNKVWSHLGVDAWRATTESGEKGSTHTIPVGKNEPPKDHTLLRNMAWAEVPLEGEVIINTTTETHEQEGSIVVPPGKLFIASMNVRELAVNVPTGSTNMELSFHEIYRRY